MYVFQAFSTHEGGARFLFLPRLCRYLTFDRLSALQCCAFPFEEWKNALKQAQREKLLILEHGERVRDYVARIMGTSAAVIGDYNRINKNAVPEVKEQFENVDIIFFKHFQRMKAARVFLFFLVCVGI